MKRTILVQATQYAKNKNNTHPKQRGFRHFSFIVQNNKIIEIGMNREAPPLTVLGYSKFSGIHAENDAYRKARGVLDQSKTFEIINIRLNKAGDLRLSKPCKHCYRWLTTLRCSNIFYSTNEGDFRVISTGEEYDV